VFNKGGKMKSVTGWWFSKKRKLANGDGRNIEIGKTHTVTGKIVPCRHGLHLSKNIIDALRYAPGNIIYKVRGHGVIIPHDGDKFACSKRTYIAGGISIEEVLRRFARSCAMDVISMWDAPEVVIQYLKSGKEDLRDAAKDAAWYAAYAAAWYAAKDAAYAALYAAKDAAKDAAWYAANAAANAAAWDAARAKQNIRLHKMVMYQFSKRETKDV